MKIAFLCSSLEPGRDGVGDYTRRLAVACAAFGYRCLVLALNDRHVTALTRDESNPACVQLRWPATAAWSERSTQVRDEIAAFAPDHLSWQFVSYGFHPKGIVGPALIALAASLAAYPTQVMLHEIWIGVARGDSWWARFTGWRQRRSILAFLAAAKPDPLQTSTASYAAALAPYGWTATLLPLFSNIPVVPAPARERTDAIDRHVSARPGRNGLMVAATFGTLHPQWHPEAAARWLQAAAARQGRSPVLLVIGRTGRHGPRILAQLARTGLPVAVTGELSPADVSCLLQAVDFGISPHPCALTDKSGVVAAMLDHGLPILLPRDDWRLRDGPELGAHADPRIARMADLTDTTTDAWLGRRHSASDSFPATVSLFLRQLAP